MVRGLVVMRLSWAGHPDYQNTNLVRGVVVVRLSLPGDPGYKKTYISEKKSIRKKIIIKWSGD